MTAGTDTGRGRRRLRHAGIALYEPRDADNPHLAAGRWRKLAACWNVSPDLMFSDRTNVQDRAVRICERCPVKATCLDYALTYRENHGVWGGMKPGDRRRLLKQRQSAAAG